MNPSYPQEAQSLEDRINEILDSGETEALLECWVDENTGRPVISLNSREPHFEVDGQCVCTLVYQSEH